MRLLLLGGTTEARELADALTEGDAGPVEVILSLAGRTRTPASGSARLRVGGFGGPTGLGDYLRDERIDLLIDATHPFATRISANAAAARAAGVPMLRLERPAWAAQPGDRWKMVPDMAAAADAVKALAKRVFLTVGINEIDAFAKCPDVYFLVRLIEPPVRPLGLPRHQLVLARGPFDAANEADLMHNDGIDTLVTKNSGGKATRAKLDAARRLKLPVIMVDRPPEPDTPRVTTPDAALAWIMDKRRDNP